MNTGTMSKDAAPAPQRGRWAAGEKKMRDRAMWKIESALLAAALFAVSCAGPSSPPLRPADASPRSSRRIERAAVELQHVEKAAAFESSLAERYRKLAPTGTAWLEVQEGAAPILVSAPHATYPTREGKLRDTVDAGTGSLAVMLHELAGATVIFTTYASPSDPNYYDSNEYKEALKKLLEKHRPLIVLDLHASHPYRPYDVDLGTMQGASLLGRTDLLDQLVASLREEGLTNLSLDYYPAAKAATVAKWVSQLGTPCIQLEVSSTWTDPLKDDIHAHRYAQFLQALVRFARGLSTNSPAVQQGNGADRPHSAVGEPTAAGIAVSTALPELATGR